MACLNSLPVELLHHVCIYLNSKEVLQMISVNRYFYTILYSNLFQNVKIDGTRKLHLFLTALENGRQNSAHYGWATKTFQIVYTPIMRHQLAILLQECPRISELDMDSIAWHHICPHKRGRIWNPNSDAFRECLNITFTQYQNLTVLSLNLSGYTSQIIDIYQLLPLVSGLHTLKLLNVYHLLTMNDMDKIHTYCPRLMDLTLSGFCLNRTRIPLPVTQCLTLRHLCIEFSSGWSYYYNWLWYIGRKYINLSSLRCECTSAMGIRSPSVLDEQEMEEGFTVFAQQHALTLKKLELINIVFDKSFMEALRDPYGINYFYGNDDDDIMINIDDDIDNKDHVGSMMDWNTTATPMRRTRASLTSAKFNNHTTFIKPEVFVSILHYVQHTIRTLSIAWPMMGPDHIHLCNCLMRCVFLTELAIQIPGYMVGMADNNETVPFDQILQCCPLLIKLHINHGKIYMVGHGNHNGSVNTLNYPLKTLVLEFVFIPSCFMVMENYGLLNLEQISLDHCAIYNMNPRTPSNPKIMLDWLFPIPAPPSLIESDSTLTLPRRPLTISLYHNLFVNPETNMASLVCDYVSISQHGKGEEGSWILRSGYIQKILRMSSSMLRRKSGQLKRNNYRQQVPSEFHDGQAPTTPNVGILLYCHSVDSLCVNGLQLI
ncbi:hypothetical protein BCR42DRAFT_452682 [Absidia repens]|uniref:F-box domain-containing protein n=1 Tax=Absidia repens TaxID=90262 RepID=A0A1X2ICW6_9FUNG|nr:hypothetical protein BCR42DRAFT_452682 [Absidia repens]